MQKSISRLEVISFYLMIANFGIWVVACSFVVTGVRSASYTVWITVYLPVFGIIAIMIKGFTLGGGSEGISMFLMGSG